MKKIILTLSLLVAGIGAAYSQSTIWKPYTINVDTAWGIRWMNAVDTNTVWSIPYNGSHPASNSNVFVKTGNGRVFTKGNFLPDTLSYNSSNIVALDSMTAYISLFADASETSGGNTAGVSGKIIKTLDGGVTWTNASDSLTMFTGVNNFPDWVYFYDHNNGIALGDPNGNTTTPGSGTNMFEIWRTHYGGTNWTRVADANVPVPNSGEYGLTNCYTTLGKRVWYGTGTGRVFMSSDSGKTWTVSTGATIGFGGGVEGLAFRDSMNGIAWGLAASSSTTNSLMKTNNGGVTWTAITPSATNTGLGAFCVVPGRNAYMSVGLNSATGTAAAYVTSITPDDGTTWNVLDQGTTNAFRMLQVQMLDSAHGWAGSFTNDSLPLGKNGMDKYKGPKIALACPLSLTSSATAICSGDSAMLTASGLNTYTWSPSGANTSTITVKPSATASYTVAAATTAGCTNTQTVSITVNPTPTVTVVNAVGASVGNDTLCTGGATYLTASGATTYSWSPSTGLNTHLGLHVTATPTTTTTYTVLGTLGACTSIVTPTITVLSTPSPTLTVNSPSVCLGNSVTVNASGLSTYTWSPATGLSSTTGTSVVASPTATAHYLVTGLDGTHTCETTNSFTVTVKALPTINVTTTTATLCVNATATLTASGTSNTYTWSTSANTATISVTPTVTTSYTVVGTSTATTCSNTHVFTQNVNSGCFAGIEKISNNTDISIYPNPNNGFVNISMATIDENTSAHITNMIGQEVFKTSLKDVTTNMDLSSLEKGIYMLTITNGQSKHVEKLIIQ